LATNGERNDGYAAAQPFSGRIPWRNAPSQNPDVRALYRQFQAARERIRATIRQNINVEVAAFTADVQVGAVGVFEA